MPHKPQYNFSEGVLQQLALYATKQISQAEITNWLYSHGTENPEQFLKEREQLLCAIGAVIEHHRKDNP